MLFFAPAMSQSLDGDYACRSESSCRRLHRTIRTTMRSRCFRYIARVGSAHRPMLLNPMRQPWPRAGSRGHVREHRRARPPLPVGATALTTPATAFNSAAALSAGAAAERAVCCAWKASLAPEPSGNGNRDAEGEDGTGPMLPIAAPMGSRTPSPPQTHTHTHTHTHTQHTHTHNTHMRAHRPCTHDRRPHTDRGSV